MKDDVLEHAPPTGVRFEPGSEVERLVEVLAAAYYRLDTDIDQLRRDRYLETATGVELDRRANPLGVDRPAGEGDAKFRRRALAGRARALSRASFDDFARVCLAALNADPDEVSITKNYDLHPGAIIVSATSDVFVSSPFAKDEIIDLLEGALPMDRRVRLQEADAFQFSVDGQSQTGSGFSDGFWTS